MSLKELKRGEILMAEPERIFICYAREDQNAAVRLFGDLRKAGLNPWIDIESLLPGQRWDITIRQAIRESRYFLALLSSESVKKRGFLQKEIREALNISDEFPEKYIFLIPVRLDDCDPPYQKLREFQWVDMFPDWDDGMNRLLTAIETEKDTLDEKSKFSGANLEDLNREILSSQWKEGKTESHTKAYLSILRMNGGGIEVSLEYVNGTIPALKSSVFVDTGDRFEQLAKDFGAIDMLSIFQDYFLKYPNRESSGKFLAKFKENGEALIKCVGSEEITEMLDIPYLILETNIEDIPFELMWADNFFSLKYAMGRRLRIEKPAVPRQSENTRIPRALIIADPTGNLNEAVSECNYVNTRLSSLIDTDYLEHTDATYKKVVTLLQSGYTIIHYAGHLDENGLVLSDGYLDSDTIQENLKGNPLVFVNGCRSARRAFSRVAEAFLYGGAIGYIGCFWRVSDKLAAKLAIDFYINALENYTIGEVLRLAKKKAFYEGNFAWAYYILFGDPTLQLFRG
jgi:hypothetical protein